jgi:hypothetical protein
MRGGGHTPFIALELILDTRYWIPDTGCTLRVRKNGAFLVYLTSIQNPASSICNVIFGHNKGFRK